MVIRLLHVLPKILITILAATCLAAFTNIDDRFIIELSAKLEQYNQAFPKEKVYLQIDRTVYQPGEDIWFKGYILDKISLRPIERSKTLFVKILSENGETVAEDKFIVRNGYSIGDLSIPEIIDDGYLKLVAYTSWMKNYDDSVVFSKNILVKKLSQTDLILPKVALDMSFVDSTYRPGEEVAVKVNTSVTEDLPLEELTYSYELVAGETVLTSGGGYALNQGAFYIRFELPAQQSATQYVLHLTTKYQTQTINVAGVVPVDLPISELQFFPEGGDIITGVQSTVAFKAADKFGNPLTFEGHLENSVGAKVLDVKTTHEGMGSFHLKPYDSAYYLVVTKPNIGANKFPVVPIRKHGMTLNLIEQNSKVLYMRVASSEARKKERIFVTASVRGQLYWSISGNLKDEAFVTIPTTVLPTGIAQVTVFNGQGIPQAERLVFVNADRKLNISVVTDKRTYKPRELVKAEILVTNHEGEAVPANLSMTAFDNMYSFLSRKRDPNIFTHIFLESDLIGQIENPGYYFENTEESRQALDLIMLTRGWRTFDFDRFLSDSSKYRPASSRDYFEGQVVNNWGKPSDGAKVSIVQSGTYAKYEVTAGIDGRFYFDKTKFQHSPSEILFSAVNDRGKDRVKITINEFNEEQYLQFYKQKLISDSIRDISADEIRYKSLEYSGDRYSFLKDLGEYQLLREILIEEKRLIPEKVDEKVTEFRSFSTDSKTGEDLKNSDDFLGILRQVTAIPYVDYSNGNIFFRSRRGSGQIINGAGSAGTRVDDATGTTEQTSDISRFDNTVQNFGALFILNGTPVGNDFNVLNYLRPEMIEFVTVLKGSRAGTIYGGRARNGVVFVTTRKSLEVNEKDEDTNFVITNNFAFPRKFVGRSYATEEELINLEPDLRNTLHWEPEIIVDQDGKATVEFYNSDRNTWIEGKIEGITPGGLVGTGTFSYRIDKAG